VSAREARPAVKPDRPESDFERQMREARDAQPMISRCAVAGCGFHVAGTAGECREAALAHRRTEHPRLRRNGINPKPKAKPAHEQTAKDRRILADLAERRRGGRITAERLAAARARYALGESQMAIARLVFAEWGYKTVAACQAAISREFRRVGVAPRAGRPPVGTPRRRRTLYGQRLTPPRLDACGRLLDAGFSADAIAKLAWELFSYADSKSAAVAIRRSLAARGVAVNRGRRKPSLTDRQARQILADADPGLQAAA
jgi:hypothetical protein